MMVCCEQPGSVEGILSHNRGVGLSDLLKVPSNPNCSMISIPKVLTPVQQPSARGCRPIFLMSLQWLSAVTLLVQPNT